MLIPIADIKIKNIRRAVDTVKVAELADSIKEIGLINPVTLDGNKCLIAGAHRIEAFKLLGKTEIEAVIINLDGLYAELAEIDENLMRNELHYAIRGEQFSRRKEIYEELYPNTKANVAGGIVKHNLASEIISFAEDTAKKTGVSRRTVEQEIQIASKLTPEAKEMVIASDLPKTEALKLARMDAEKQNIIADRILTGKADTVADAQREVKREEIITNLENVAAMEAKSVEGVYDVVVLDPPWGMQKIERDERPNQSEFDYPTMTEAELSDLPIPAAESCHVWLWTTQKHLPVAFRLLEKWGLKYVCTFVWHKTGGFQPFGLPQYNCEFVLYARKGTPSFIDTKDFPTCFTAPRTGHSEKPDEFYNIVRRVTAGRRLDMFARRKSQGFDSWGKESES